MSVVTSQLSILFTGGRRSRPRCWFLDFVNVAVFADLVRHLVRVQLLLTRFIDVTFVPHGIMPKIVVNRTTRLDRAVFVLLCSMAGRHVRTCQEVLSVWTVEGFRVFRNCAILKRRERGRSGVYVGHKVVFTLTHSFRVFTLSQSSCLPVVPAVPDSPSTMGIILELVRPRRRLTAGVQSFLQLRAGIGARALLSAMIRAAFLVSCPQASANVLTKRVDGVAAILIVSQSGSNPKQQTRGEIPAVFAICSAASVADRLPHAIIARVCRNAAHQRGWGRRECRLHIIKV